MRQIISLAILFILFSVSSIGQTTSIFEDNFSTLNSEEGIYRIPSILDSKKMDNLIKKIHLFLATNSKYVAEIYIADEDLKAAKITKGLIIDRLNRRGWRNKVDYVIFKEIR